MQYYTFRFGAHNAGYFMTDETADSITMAAVFRLDGMLVENPFALRLAHGRVTHYKAGTAAWQPMPDDPCIYPTSAYPLVVRCVGEQFTYLALHEGTGEIVPTDLQRIHDRVIETRGTEIVRQFWLAGDAIIKIDWGGPVSELCESLEQAKAGSDV